MENDFNQPSPSAPPVTTPLSPVSLPSQEPITPPQINDQVGGMISQPAKGKKIKKIIIILLILVLISIAAGVLVFQYFMQKSKNSVKDLVSTSAPLPTNPVAQQVKKEVECGDFPDMIESCTKYTCEFDHPATGEKLAREISGIEDDKCRYAEEMPNGGKLNCNYGEEMRKLVARYYREVGNAASISADFEVDLDEEENDIDLTYTLDGKLIQNPVQEALETGECVITGY